MPRGSEDRAAALARAATRLAHAMRDSYGPVDRMAAALERMMRVLAGHARVLERLHEARAAGAAASAAALTELEHCREALEREITICIESLQFHDSLIQQLVQVRAGLATASGVPHPPHETRLPDGAAGSVELF